MTLVAGVDSSTQSCKVVIREASTGELVRQGRAAHPEGTEVEPQAWWRAFKEAAQAAGGLNDVAAIAVGGQQHGMVALDNAGDSVRPALSWNDTRSAPQAERLVGEFGGPRFWADETGSVPVASFTITKLAWMAEHEPANASRTSAVCLPHDWLTWMLMGGPKLLEIKDLVTDRGDASGTGYFNPEAGTYCPDLLRAALGHDVQLPRVLGPGQRAGSTAVPGLSESAVVGPGTGDNMAAALGVGASVGDVILSIGTSGVVCAVSESPTHDSSGEVAGFADATGNYLPLVCTLNAARVLDATAKVLGVGLDQLSAMALRAPAGCDGMAFVPYLEGERTPNRPNATGTLHGLTLSNMSPTHVARAAVEGVLCGLADGLDALVAQGIVVRRVILIGGGARSAAVRDIAPQVFAAPVVVPEPGEYVADGAARQAAWVLSGEAQPPRWELGGSDDYRADPEPTIRDQYASARGTQ
ncbi:MAG: xylulokinase [Candidatus Nanopelagicales bacterium]|nr:xylulokinase [Candidatus Nanopelagicales bacterium]MDZ4249976.1 xylulokinase [Candidatus Nanopelagicales bacterium]